MKIVVLGWGSLIWDPQNLRIKSEWHNDGPALPIEFARVSQDGRLTLVLYPNSEKTNVLWAEMDTRNLDEAIETLKQRECTTNSNIGFIEVRGQSHSNSEIISHIREWAKNKNVDAVIWTGLQSNFKEKTKMDLTENNVIRYLSSLENCKKGKAEEYIRKAPAQIRTKMRKIVEEGLGWIYVGNSR